jgi:hypothetical protein
MTIEEAKKARKKMETKIYSAVADFQIATGLLVSEVRVHTQCTWYPEDQAMVPHVNQVVSTVVFPND